MGAAASRTRCRPVPTGSQRGPEAAPRPHTHRRRSAARLASRRSHKPLAPRRQLPPANHEAQRDVLPPPLFTPSQSACSRDDSLYQSEHTPGNKLPARAGGFKNGPILINGPRRRSARMRSPARRRCYGSKGAAITGPGLEERSRILRSEAARPIPAVCLKARGR